MEFDLSAMARMDQYKLMTGLVVPRPIAFVSTLSKDGVRNAAPFSFFNMFGVEPAIIVLGINTKGSQQKDTFANIVETGEFVVNVVPASLAEKMNASSADVASDVDEFDLAGLAAAPSLTVRPDRIADSPANLECKLVQTLDVEHGRALIIGRVVHIHVADDLLDGAKVNQSKLDLIGRMGGPLYTHTRDIFAMKRPATVTGE